MNVTCDHCGMDDSIQETEETRILWECSACEGLNVLFDSESAAFNPQIEYGSPEAAGLADGVTSVVDSDGGAGKNAV